MDLFFNSASTVPDPAAAQIVSASIDVDAAFSGFTVVQPGAEATFPVVTFELSGSAGSPTSYMYMARAQSGTSAPTAPETTEAERELSVALEKAKDETFEDGYENELSRFVAWFVSKYGNAGLLALACTLLVERINPSVAGEVLRHLGLSRDEETFPIRVWTIASHLDAELPSVRDAAILGLTFLEDPRVARWLEGAMATETHPILRASIEDALAEVRG